MDRLSSPSARPQADRCRGHAHERACTRFTLIELLVVIAIVSVLAAMLLPVLGRARAQARVASCASSLKQVSMAIAMYADDHDDYVPQKETGWSAGLDRYGNPIGVAPSTNAAGRFRDLVRLGYMPKDMLYCPAQSGERKWYPGYLLNEDSGDLIKSHHYGGSGDWIYFGGGVMNLGPHPSYTTYTDKTLRQNDMNAEKWPMVMDRIAGPDHRYYTVGGTNHEPGNCRGGNIVYADGHVAWINVLQTQRSGGTHDTLVNVPIDEHGRSVPHIGWGGLNYYDSKTAVVGKSTIIARGYLYRVP